MSEYCYLPEQARLILAGALFFAALGELALCLYRRLCGEKLRRCAPPAALYVFLLVVLSECVTGGARIRLPWLCLPLITAAVAAHSAILLRKEYLENQKRITPGSVREAIDRLDSGICFADDSGRLILINRAMNRLCFALTGRYPQRAEELAEPGAHSLPDGRVWEIKSAVIGPERVTQVTAQDVTELYRLNEKLERDNAAIREAIVKMRGMIARMSELAREQEALELKIQIHDDIGASLIALSELSGDEERQIETLKRALAFFGSRPAGRRDGLTEFAAECGVTLTIEGEPPLDGVKKALFDTAVRECVTNCVRHAGGSAVHARLYGDRAVITNDGAPPDGEIVEGGGLSALRRKAEEAGGELIIESAPRFRLTLKYRRDGI